MGMDHRWGQRRATDFVVHVVATSGRTVAARVLNVSLTGAYLETSVPLRLNSLIHLMPYLPDNFTAGSNRVAANVVRHDALGVGLQWCERLTKGVQRNRRRSSRASRRNRSGARPPRIRSGLTGLPASLIGRRRIRCRAGVVRHSCPASSCAAARNSLTKAASTVPQCPVVSVCSPAKNRVSATGSVMLADALSAPAGA